MSEFDQTPRPSFVHYPRERERERISVLGWLQASQGGVARVSPAGRAGDGHLLRRLAFRGHRQDRAGVLAAQTPAARPGEVHLQPFLHRALRRGDQRDVNEAKTTRSTRRRRRTRLPRLSRQSHDRRRRQQQQQQLTKE